MRLLAIDPGIRTGCALFEYGVLVSACEGEPMGCEADQCIIELPQIYRGGRSKADPNDLITLAVRIGRYAERVHCPVDLITPAKWKGQLSKDVVRARLKKILSSEEQSVIPKNASHDVWDAIGLGRWYLKGRGRPGVF